MLRCVEIFISQEHDLLLGLDSPLFQSIFHWKTGPRKTVASVFWDAVKPNSPFEEENPPVYAVTNRRSLTNKIFATFAFHEDFTSSFVILLSLYFKMCYTMTLISSQLWSYRRWGSKPSPHFPKVISWDLHKNITTIAKQWFFFSEGVNKIKCSCHVMK